MAGDRDQCYAEEGWRAWDGMLRWRLEHGQPGADS
jgi:hypothetical protein